MHNRIQYIPTATEQTAPGAELMEWIKSHSGLSAVMGVGSGAALREYCAAQAAVYEVIWWIPGRHPAVVRLSLALLGEELSLFPRYTDIDWKVSLVREWLETHSNYLLVVSNADDVQTAATLLPPKVMGRVIIGCEQECQKDLGMSTYTLVGTPGNSSASQVQLKPVNHDAEELTREVIGFLDQALSVCHSPQTTDASSPVSGQLRNAAKLFRAHRCFEACLTCLHAATHMDNGIPDHEALIDDYGDLGACALISGRFQEAARHFEQALELLDRNDQTRARLLNQAGMAAIQLAQYDQAAKLLALARELVRQTESDTALHASILTNMGVVHDLSSRPDLSRICFEAALELAESIASNQQGAVAAKALGSALTERGDHRAALRALAIADRMLQECGYAESPERASVLNDMGCVYHSLGKLAEAESCLQHALELDSLLLGPNHLRIASRAANLAHICMAAGQLQDALSLHRRALQSEKAHWREDDTRLASRHGYIGEVLTGLGRIDEAILEFETAVHIAKSGKHDPSLAAAQLSNLGYARFMLGDFNSAVDMFEEALHLLRSFEAADLRQEIDVLCNLGMAHERLRNRKTALNMFLRARELLQRAAPGDSASRQAIEARIAACSDR